MLPCDGSDAAGWMTRRRCHRCQRVRLGEARQRPASVIRRPPRPCATWPMTQNNAYRKQRVHGDHVRSSSYRRKARGYYATLVTRSRRSARECLKHSLQCYVPPYLQVILRTTDELVDGYGRMDRVIDQNLLDLSLGTNHQTGEVADRLSGLIGDEDAFA
jgi:hypothetical protein